MNRIMSRTKEINVDMWLLCKAMNWIMIGIKNHRSYVGDVLSDIQDKDPDQKYHRYFIRAVKSHEQDNDLVK